MGNFNAVLTGADRINGNPVQEMEIRDFNEFIIDASMIELKATERESTWSNGCICSKIDRAMVNVEWMLNMNQVEISFRQPETSDHSPLSLELDSNMRGNHKAFKFFNCIAAHPDFLPKVKKAWRGGHIRDLKEVWFKLKKVKENLKQHNSK
ncbi:hypothetical protein KY284_020451 [Solanum tuberosum]|nr:hypothetical protein KY284_020451 [Solanum tuberosum]